MTTKAIRTTYLLPTLLHIAVGAETHKTKDSTQEK